MKHEQSVSPKRKLTTNVHYFVYYFLLVAAIDLEMKRRLKMCLANGNRPAGVSGAETAAGGILLLRQ